MARFTLLDTIRNGEYVNKTMHLNLTMSGYYRVEEVGDNGETVIAFVRPGIHGNGYSKWWFTGENLAYDADTGIYSGIVTNVKFALTDDAFDYNQFEVTGLNVELAQIVAEPDNIMELLTAGSDRVIGSAGDDNIGSGDSQDLVYGRGGDDYVYLGAGSDFASGGAGNDQIFGDAGADKIKGNRGNDYLNGGDGEDVLKGNGGKDYLAGAADSDVLIGGRGADFLDGGDDNDLLIGGKGADTFLTGSGEDLLVFKFKQGKDTILDFEAGMDMIDLTATKWKKADLKAALHNVEEGVLLDLGKGEVLIKGVSKSDLDLNDDFILA